MTLASGTKIGPYEILSPLGAGGMGEVYRARDAKLHRDVAVKVVPEAVAGDAEGRGRDAVREAPGRPRPDRRGPRDRAPDRGRARGGSRKGDRASGSEARQRE